MEVLGGLSWKPPPPSDSEGKGLTLDLEWWCAESSAAVPEAGRCWSAARRGTGPAGEEGNEVGGGGVVRGRAEIGRAHV